MPAPLHLIQGPSGMANPVTRFQHCSRVNLTDDDLVIKGAETDADFVAETIYGGAQLGPDVGDAGFVS